MGDSFLCYSGLQYKQGTVVWYSISPLHLELERLRNLPHITVDQTSLLFFLFSGVASSFSIGKNVYWGNLSERNAILLGYTKTRKSETKRQNDQNETTQTKRPLWSKENHIDYTTIETSGGGNVAQNVDFTSDILAFKAFKWYGRLTKLYFFPPRDQLKL